MAIALDDLGHEVNLAGPARRIVSLVPSLTEAIAATVPDRLVGATDWCTHPAGLDVARVRGTKNPDRAAIAALRPDLVIANQEENRRADVERLRAAGVDVWVTVIESVAQAFASMRRACSPDLVLLPDEPYAFAADDGPEAFADSRVVLVPGRLLTWYGPSLTAARAQLLALII